MTQPKKEPKARIPKLETREELAEFWDTHDITDFLDELHPVDLRSPKRAAGSGSLSEGMTVRLDPASANRLREEARREGLAPSTLVRLWILEHLRAEPGSPANRRSG